MTLLSALFRWSRQLLLAVLFIVCFSTPTQAAVRQDGLWNAQDVLNNTLWGWTAQHKISFTLPSDSFEIRNIDYIQIYLPEFTNPTAPTLVTGQYSGIPIFSVNGQYLQVTGITVLPGAHITIEGATAVNPSWNEAFEVVIMVTEDYAATKLKNYQNVLASPNYANVSVTATIPNPLANLRVSGWTGPGTFIIIAETDAVIGTDVSNQIGGFNHLFSGLVPTTHYLTLYGIDEDGLVTSPVPLQIYTAAFQETSLSNILLSPTIITNANSFYPGDAIIATGSALPESDITLFVDSPLRAYYTTASSSGKWQYTITNSNEYIYGDYRIYAMAQNTIGLQSLVSHSQLFSIVASGSAGTACGDISHGDLNCDGNINLTDFSILMYYWGTQNAAADINFDYLVNLADFSILMYWWAT